MNHYTWKEHYEWRIYIPATSKKRTKSTGLNGRLMDANGWQLKASDTAVSRNLNFGEARHNVCLTLYAIVVEKTDGREQGKRNDRQSDKSILACLASKPEQLVLG